MESDMVQHQVEDTEQSKLLQRMVMDVVHKHECTSVKDVVNKLQQLDKSTKLEEILAAVNKLRDDKITLSESRVECDFWNYLTDLLRTIPFWLTIFVSLATLITVYLTPQVEPWSMVRIVVGAVFVLFIPGYSLIHILFPTKEMDFIERTALSVGLSFAVTPIIGLILNYSSLGIRLDPLIAFLSTVSIAFSFAGTYRRFLLRQNYQPSGSTKTTLK